MDERTNQSIKNFILYVADNYQGLVEAYLFGSSARGLDRPESDLDIALVFEKLQDAEKFDLQVELLLSASKFDSRIEPHPLSSDDFLNDHPFAEEIRKTGIKIKSIFSGQDR